MNEMKANSIRAGFLLHLLLMATFSSCDRPNEKIDTVCDSGNPVWLTSIRVALEANADITGSQIVRYVYNDECVFWIDPCLHCPDGLISVYNGQGDNL